MAADELWDLLGGHAESGVRVNRETALSHNVFWRCANLLSGDIAKMPLTLFERKGGGKTEDVGHPAHHLMGYEWVPGEISALVGKRTLTYHALAEGNGYAFIQRDGSGTPLELWPLLPHRTYPVRVNRKLWYVTEVNTAEGMEERKIPAENIFHLKGLSFDGLVGYCAILKMRETLGLAMAYDLYGSTFFRNNARPNIVLRYPKRLSPEAAKNLRESFDRIQSGLENAHRTAVLEEGGDLTQLTINARDAQLLEGMAFSRVSIANFFGVPPHKVGSPTNTSYGSLEQENEGYLEDGGGLGYWMPAWVNECWTKLLTEEQKRDKTHYFAFKTRQLLRANITARTQYYTSMVTNGILCPDEVREEEGYDPKPDGSGRTFLHPANMVIEGEEDQDDDGGGSDPGKPPQAVADGPAAGDTERSAILRAFEDAAARMVRRLAHAANRAGKKPSKFVAFLDGLESAHLSAVTEALTPFDAEAEATAKDLIHSVRDSLLAVSGECCAAELPAAVAARMVELTAHLPGLVTRSRKPARSTGEALQILERMPDAAAGKVAVTMPVDGGAIADVTEDDLRDLPTATVKIQDLVATQPLVSRAHVTEFVRKPDAGDHKAEADSHKAGNVILEEIPGDKPYVVSDGGKQYVYDGHHRITAYQLLGITKVDAYLYDAKPKGGKRQAPLPFRRAAEDKSDDLDEKARLMAEILVESLDGGAVQSLLTDLRYSDDQPRGPDGRWIAGGDASHQAARDLIAKHGSGKVPAEKAKELHEHLSKMTVKQLHELKREHGLKASGNKAELVTKLAERIKAKLEEDAGGKAVGLKPGELHEPGKPMAERLNSYKGADALIAKLEAAGQAYAEAVDKNARAAEDLRQKTATINKLMDRWQAHASKGERVPNALKKELNQAESEAIKARDAYRASYQAMVKAFEESKRVEAEAGKDLKATSPIQMARIDHISATNPAHGGRSAEAAEYVRSITERGQTDSMAPVVAKPTPPVGDGRAFFSGREHGSPQETVNTHSTNDVGTHVHELGHYLENNLKGAQTAAREFLEHRVGTEKPQNLKALFPQSGYKGYEEGRKDNFDRAFSGSSAYYVGKVYAKDTEILSMGLEKLFRDPAGFAAKDPEYFKFIHGVLKGHLRNEN